MRLVHAVSAAACAAIFVGLLAFVEFREACISTDEQWARLAEKEEMLNQREQKMLACNCSCAELDSARPNVRAGTGSVSRETMLKALLAAGSISNADDPKWRSMSAQQAAQMLTAVGIDVSTLTEATVAAAISLAEGSQNPISKKAPVGTQSTEAPVTPKRSDHVVVLMTDAHYIARAFCTIRRASVRMPICAHDCSCHRCDRVHAHAHTAASQCCSQYAHASTHVYPHVD